MVHQLSRLVDVEAGALIIFKKYLDEDLNLKSWKTTGHVLDISVDGHC